MLGLRVQQQTHQLPEILAGRSRNRGGSSSLHDECALPGCDCSAAVCTTAALSYVSRLCTSPRVRRYEKGLLVEPGVVALGARCVRNNMMQLELLGVQVCDIGGGSYCSCVSIKHILKTEYAVVFLALVYPYRKVLGLRVKIKRGP